MFRCNLEKVGFGKISKTVYEDAISTITIKGSILQLSL
jgi:hypothetical protein